MILGGDRKKVIENIKSALETENYNVKVEEGDPTLSVEQKEQVINKYLKEKDTKKYKINNKVAMGLVKAATHSMEKNIKIVGAENLEAIKTGAIITSNHFNPYDSIPIRKLMKEAGKKKLYTVVQDSNMAMKGDFGTVMNYLNMIPVTDSVSYMKKDFPNILEEKLEENNYILIYPEQEMWLNYKKPRPLKSGAYHYARKFNVPIIPCFVEMKVVDEKETDEFYRTDYILHVLKPIYPDMNKSVKESAKTMMDEDYQQKKEAYESVYGENLNYEFNATDIVGWCGEAI